MNENERPRVVADGPNLPSVSPEELDLLSTDEDIMRLARRCAPIALALVAVCYIVAPLAIGYGVFARASWAMSFGCFLVAIGAFVEASTMRRLARIGMATAVKAGIELRCRAAGIDSLLGGDGGGN